MAETTRDFARAAHLADLESAVRSAAARIAELEGELENVEAARAEADERAQDLELRLATCQGALDAFLLAPPDNLRQEVIRLEAALERLPDRLKEEPVPPDEDPET
jgi:hypothetical protein